MGPYWYSNNLVSSKVVIKDFENNKDKIYVKKHDEPGAIKIKNKKSDAFIYIGKELLAKVKGAAGDLSKKGSYIV